MKILGIHDLKTSFGSFELKALNKLACYGAIRVQNRSSNFQKKDLILCRIIQVKFNKITKS